MTPESVPPQEPRWRCAQCDQPLVMALVTVSYLGNRFTTEMPRCPQCGLVMVPEELAVGKMAEVEQLLEDK